MHVDGSALGNCTPALLCLGCSRAQLAKAVYEEQLVTSTYHHYTTPELQACNVALCDGLQLLHRGCTA